jgi:polar amino acid transport system permease protein
MPHLSSRLSRLLRKYGVSILILAVVGYTVYTVFSSQAMDWTTFRQYVVSKPIMEGLRLTVLLAVGAQVLAIVVGVLVALARESSNRILAWLSITYIAVLRAVPLLVQILIWFNLALFFPTIHFGIPFTNIGPTAETNSLIGPITACLIALALAESAYMAEIVRGGIEAVPKGQSEAARSLGMTRGLVYRRIILPQAARIMVPPTGNQFIGMLKATSLVSVVGVGDLLTKAQYIYAANYKVMPLLFVATFWYLVLTVAASLIQHGLERRLAHKPLIPRGRFKKSAEPMGPGDVVLGPGLNGEFQ